MVERIINKVDEMYELVVKNKHMPLSQLSEELKMPIEKVEEWADVLNRNGVLVLVYPSNPLAEVYLSIPTEEEIRKAEESAEFKGYKINFFKQVKKHSSDLKQKIESINVIHSTIQKEKHEMKLISSKSEIILKNKRETEGLMKNQRQASEKAGKEAAKTQKEYDAVEKIVKKHKQTARKLEEKAAKCRKLMQKYAGKKKEQSYRNQAKKLGDKIEQSRRKTELVAAHLAKVETRLLKEKEAAEKEKAKLSELKEHIEEHSRVLSRNQTGVKEIEDKIKRHENQLREHKQHFSSIKTEVTKARIKLAGTIMLMIAAAVMLMIALEIIAI